MNGEARISQFRRGFSSNFAHLTFVVGSIDLGTFID